MEVDSAPPTGFASLYTRLFSASQAWHSWLMRFALLVLWCFSAPMACKGGRTSPGAGAGSTGGMGGSTVFAMGGLSQVGGSSPTGGSAGGSGGKPVDVEARLAGFSRGINLDRWFLNPIAASPASYITDNELSMLTTLGFDHARVLVHLDQVFTEGRPAVLDAEGLGELDAGLDQLLAHGLRVIVDLHNTDPVQGGERYSHRLEQEPDFIDQFVEFWRAFAKHLSVRDPDKVLLQPMNEPIFEGRAAEWATDQERLVQAIRQGAPLHTILVTGNDWSNREAVMRQPLPTDPNVAVDFHYYEPQPFTFQGYYQDATTGWLLQVAQLRGLPYPGTDAELSAFAEKAPSSGAADLVREYAAGGWNAQKHLDNLAEVKAWADQHGVQLICTEFGADSVFMTKVDQLRYLKDVRTALGRSGIPWTFYDYEQGYGIVRRGQGRLALDAPVVEALGMDPASVEVAKLPAPFREPLPACADGMLDDLEDGDTAAPLGSWSTVFDSLGSTASAKLLGRPGADKSAYAATTGGEIATGAYGLQAGLSLNFERPLDASRAQGISFWARGEGMIDVQVMDANTDPEAGICRDCSPFYAPLRLTTEWTRYTVLFAGLQQSPYWGDQYVQLNPSSLRQIAWLVSTPAKKYEMAVDQVQLVGCSK
jgi:endoglucanase